MFIMSPQAARVGPHKERDARIATVGTNDVVPVDDRESTGACG
jgi:hypothetical protein